VPALLPAEVRVVVLRGSGASFSAGLDRRMFDGSGVPGEQSLPELAALPPAELEAWIAAVQAAFTWWRAVPPITIAVVQGAAVGAGFQLALACDLVLCADDARFAMRETSLGLVPDLAGTWPLVQAVGYGRALELCATGRWVPADEAVRLGLALAAVPADRLEATLADLVAGLLAPPAGAVTALKQLLAGAADRSPAEQQRAERQAQVGRLGELARLLGG
jgi:enoyl-CoA hydratase/carnithine racemase